MKKLFKMMQMYMLNRPCTCFIKGGSRSLASFLLITVVMIFFQNLSLATEPAESNPSVLERLKTFRGQRSADILQTFFINADASPVRQLPQVAISDGFTSAVVTVRVPENKKQAPSFTMQGASLQGVQRKGQGYWTLKVLPDKGTIASSLIIDNGLTLREYPLVVAPPLMVQIPFLDEADVQRFIAEPIDCNNDGVIDYIDDYIFLANFIAQKQLTGNTPAARKQRAQKRSLERQKPLQEQRYDPAVFGDL